MLNAQCSMIGTCRLPRGVPHPLPFASIRVHSRFSVTQPLSTLNPQLPGGYVLPGTDPAAGQTALPADIEQACIEQLAFWFQNKDHLGLKTFWPTGSDYRQFATADLLPSVQATLKRHTRWSI